MTFVAQAPETAASSRTGALKRPALRCRRTGARRVGGASADRLPYSFGRDSDDGRQAVFERYFPICPFIFCSALAQPTLISILCSLRQPMMRPPPGSTPGQSLATSDLQSAMGSMACASDGPASERAASESDASVSGRTIISNPLVLPPERRDDAPMV